MDSNRHDAPQAYPNKLLISLQCGDVEGSFALDVGPVENIGVAVDVHSCHAERSSQKLMVGGADGMGSGRWRTSTSEQNEYGVVFRVL